MPRHAPPGSRLFTAGAVLMVLFGAAHAGGVVVTVLHAGDVPGLREQFDAWRAFRVPGVAGFETSLWGLRQFFNFAFSVLLAGSALLAMVGVRHGAPLRAGAAVLCGMMLAVAGLGVCFGVAQAVVTGGVIAALFGASALRARGPLS